MYINLQVLFRLSKYQRISTLIFLINVEVGINVGGGIFWKKLVHNCNKRVSGKKLDRYKIMVKKSTTGCSLDSPVD